ncbi:MAG TPA: 2-hydroxyacyl-CoA dehydratase family protein, partial [Candidatus Hodarchaeales archaeon]|nr:2-hydroxyacyl-CoA dehydratase family protein [Candidatus Hodarchaeales archaeon]
STIFAENNASVVVSTYCNSWVFDNFNANDPFGSMARVYTEIFINRAEDYKQEYLLQMAKEFEVDGFVYHDCKTCPNNSNNRYRLPNRVQEKIGLPFIVVNGDMNDLRCYSEEQTKTAIEAFIEQLTVNKEMVQLQ